MDQALRSRLEGFVSEPRFGRYLEASSSTRHAVELYCWNIQLSEAFVPVLALFEVTLRNAVHHVLTRHTGSEFWFKAILSQPMYDNIFDLVNRITRRQGQPPTAGKIISEITFGFWPKLFARHYQTLWWDRPSAPLSHVLQHHHDVNRATRKQFEARLEYFVVLRNRVMHQEPIFGGVRALNRPLLTLNTLHDQILEALGWLNADALTVAILLDRFDWVKISESRDALRHSIDRAFHLSR